jgi:hypothetical protein
VQPAGCMRTSLGMFAALSAVLLATAAAGPAPKAAPPAAAPGYVQVSTFPWGWATAGDQRVETIGGKLTLAPGKHTITIKCAQCATPRSTTRTVDVRSGATSKILITFEE